MKYFIAAWLAFISFAASAYPATQSFYIAAYQTQLGEFDSASAACTAFGSSPYTNPALGGWHIENTYGCHYIANGVSNYMVDVTWRWKCSPGDILNGTDCVVSSSSSSSAQSCIPGVSAGGGYYFSNGTTSGCIGGCEVSGGGVCAQAGSGPMYCPSVTQTGNTCSGTNVGGDPGGSSSSAASSTASSTGSSSGSASSGSGSSSGSNTSSGSGPGPGGGDPGGPGSSGSSSSATSSGSGTSSGSNSSGSFCPSEPCPVKVDESGTPNGDGSLNGANTDLNNAASDRNSKFSDVIDPGGKNTSWGWLPNLPTSGCAPIALGPYSVDICTQAARINAIMAWLWSLGTAYLCIAMVKNTLQGGA